MHLKERKFVNETSQKCLEGKTATKGVEQQENVVVRLHQKPFVKN